MSLAALAATLVSALFPGKADAAGSADAVAVQYHFAGAADLAGNTNFDRAKRIFSLPPASRFQDLVLDRLAGVFGNALQFGPGADSAALLRPMLNDLAQAESTGSFGGRNKNWMDFVLAARLDAIKAAAWQKNLETALQGKGEPLTAEGFSGRRWDRPGNNALWILRARDWVVAGRGEDLAGVRAAYLQNIKRDNRPAPAARETWLSADVDWPLLASWAPLSRCPFKLARTIVDVTAESGRFHATARVFYPQAVSWQSQPWRIPKELVGGPLSSFMAARDPAPYLRLDESLLRLNGNPLTNQLYGWALREMALQSYAAWPVADATNTLRKLGPEAPPVLNPILEARGHTRLVWTPKTDWISWIGIPLTAPTVEPVRDASGDFLMAKLFPLQKKHDPPSNQLWSQFQGRTDLVYYDWELTGLRLTQWRLLTEMLPVIPPPTREDAARRQRTAQNARPAVKGSSPPVPLAVTETWLSELAPALGNTVTEVSWKSPTELTVARNSPFLFTGLELVVLSHWLADAPVGPIDYTLLPRAKMSGPGLPVSR